MLQPQGEVCSRGLEEEILFRFDNFVALLGTNRRRSAAPDFADQNCILRNAITSTYCRGGLTVYGGTGVSKEVIGYPFDPPG